MAPEFWNKLTMAQRAFHWGTMSAMERDQFRDLTGLTKQLIGLEGWRVEVETMSGEKRRFIVGRSTGWKPCHIERKNLRSTGGVSADSEYRSVRRLYKVV